MHTISRQFLEETTLHHFTAEVSELSHGGQLKGRCLPRKFNVENIGNGNPFFAIEIDRDEDNFLRAVTYQQLYGCTFITIFND